MRGIESCVRGIRDKAKQITDPEKHPVLSLFIHSATTFGRPLSADVIFKPQSEAGKKQKAQ